MFNNPPETRFGGDFPTPTEWHDPLIREKFAKPGNFALFTFNEFGAEHARLLRASAPDPAPPGQGHWLGTDAGGPRHRRAPAVRISRSASTSGSR